MPSRVMFSEERFADDFEAERLVEVNLGLSVCLKENSPAMFVSLNGSIV